MAGRGDRLPAIAVPPPGPRARRLLAALKEVEAPLLAGADGADALPPLAAARGGNVADVDGNLYVDWTAGFGAAFAGHGPPEVVRAWQRQAQRAMLGLADATGHRQRLKLAKQLLNIAPVRNGRVHWAISGSDAVDLALKAAWLYTGRPRVVAFDPAYHGLGLAATAVASRPAFREPFAPLLTPDRVTRLPYGCRREVLEDTFSRHRPGAVIVEPVVGREGVRRPPEGWLTELASVAAIHDTLFIADEVLTGGGRTGRWFAVEHEGVEPDLLCCGKALAGGTPLAAVIGRAEVLAALDRGGEALHTSTFLAQPPACAAALANLRRIERLRLRERSEALGHKVENWARGQAAIDASGRGALYGLRFQSAAGAAKFARQARRRGFLLLAAGPVVQLTPPATLTTAQVEASLAAFADILRRAD